MDTFFSGVFLKEPAAANEFISSLEHCELLLLLELVSFGLVALDLDDGEGSFEAFFSGLGHFILDRSSVIFCLTLIKMGLRGESSELLELRGLQYTS